MIFFCLKEMVFDF